MNDELIEIISDYFLVLSKSYNLLGHLKFLDVIIPDDRRLVHNLYEKYAK